VLKFNSSSTINFALKQLENFFITKLKDFFIAGFQKKIFCRIRFKKFEKEFFIFVA